ncbi:MAG: T9SS C-terminal target domain-containing protein [Bacteroidetes bacterium]|nr:MAG: T9SS C-terminal target domain-containing protein [Bacteroidota bacterium]MBL1145824.1 T9SS C-terminal target domain-containing protein [Bacteroidota bacterium]NOG58618.1 T9SS type A sorting domain-containing protein [Bacteroidota bacterium]
MKKYLLTLTFTALMLGSYSKLFAQASPVQTLFTEDFEAGTPIKMIGISKPLAQNLWDTTKRLASTGMYCDTNFTGFRDTSYLVSPNVDITGFVSVNIAFDHICYIEQFDDAYLEVSFNNGASWIQTGPSNYKGGSYLKADSTFSKFSRPLDWHFSDDQWVPLSTTTAWVTENFDISTMIADPNIPTSNSMKFRFVLVDDPGSAPGRVGKHTWYLDNIIVTGATCELIPPTLTLFDPYRYIDVYDDVVYFTGPYDFSTQFRDASLIDTSILIYTVKYAAGGSFTDTINFVVTAGSNYFAEIPAQSPGDTVCYRIIITDMSACKNRTTYPLTGEVCFLVRDNLPPGCQTKPIFDFPYYQTFNATDFQVGQTIVLAEDWVNGTGDFHDWWVGQGQTPTAGTGPKIGDVGTGTGKYLYMEADGHLGQIAQLFSPCIDLYQIPNANIKFYLNMRGAGGNEFHVDLYDASTQSYLNDIIPVINGGQVDDWFDVEFNAYQYRNTITQLRFRGKTNPTNALSDIALDSFKIVYAPLVDIRMESIEISPLNPENELDEIKISFSNLGVLDVDTAYIYYEILNDTGGVIFPASPVLWTGLITPNQYLTIPIPQKYTVPLGDYAVRAWIKAPNDERAINDTSNIIKSIGLPYRGLDFFDDFEGDTIFQQIPKPTQFGNQWGLGKPKGKYTNTTFSGDLCWDLNPNGSYSGNNEFVSLYTPFFDFTAADSMILYFYNNRSMNLVEDGVGLEYSLDEGLTWDTVKGQNDPKRKFWYNENLSGSTVGGFPVFSDTTSKFFGSDKGWVESEVLLEDLFNNEKYVLFRFKFFALKDETGGEGMSIDDFRIVDPINQNAQSVKILYPTTSCEVGDLPRKIRAVIKNVGNRTMSNVPIDITVTRINGPNSPAVQTASEVLNTTIFSRDRYHFTTNTAFDFSEYGDYEIKIITKLPGDARPKNDTMIKMVEHFEGCNIFFEFGTNQEVTDSSRWRLEATHSGREYIYSEPYAGWAPNTFNTASVCVKNGAKVRFKLGDIDTSIAKFTIRGYDTLYVDEGDGGPDAVDANFDWICPPQRSAKPLNFIFDDNVISFPFSKSYSLDLIFQNNGLDSLDNLDLTVHLDGNKVYDTTFAFDPPTYLNGFRFRRKKKVDIGDFKLSPGIHHFRALTLLPNGQPDLQPEDDTLDFYFTVIDTVKANLATTGYCTDFEAASNPKWLSLNPYTYSTKNSFEIGTPNKTNLQGAKSGMNAWVTLIDSNYSNFDSSSLYSPFMLFQKDSCYTISFENNYSFDDTYHDGGHVQYSVDEGSSWNTIGKRDFSLPYSKNWYNSPNIVAIPNNRQNQGWTGISNGYVKSENIIGFNKDTYAILRWRFESDGSGRGEGWAIDDFCVQATNVSNCFTVGLDEYQMGIDKLYLGQNIPNPASNNTIIPYYLPNASNIDFTVVNMLGQPVYQEKGNRSQGDHLIHLDLTNLAEGVYYYWLISDGEKITSKMVVTK